MMSLVALATTSDTINALFSLLLNGAVVWFLAVYVLCALALLLDRRQARGYRLLALGALLFSLWVVYASPLSDTGPALVFLTPALRLDAAAQEPSCSVTPNPGACNGSIGGTGSLPRRMLALIPA